MEVLFIELPEAFRAKLIARTGRHSAPVGAGAHDARLLDHVVLDAVEKAAPIEPGSIARSSSSA
jgi:hypothetical protein